MIHPLRSHLRPRLLALTLALALTLTACSGQGGEPVGPADYPLEVGSTHTKILQRPQAVVSLSPSLTQTLEELGLGGRLVGVSDYCALPEPSTGEEFLYQKCGVPQAPNLGAIKRSGAGVVLTPTPLTAAQLTALQQENIDVVVIPPANNLSQLRENYRSLFLLLWGSQEGGRRAGEFLTYFDGKVTEIAACAGTVSPITPDPLPEEESTDGTGSSTSSESASSQDASPQDTSTPSASQSSTPATEDTPPDESADETDDPTDEADDEPTTPTKPLAVYVITDLLTVATGDTLEGEILELLGLENAGAPHTGYVYPKELEKELDPDLIISAGYLSDEAILTSDCYKSTVAGKAEALYRVDGTAFEIQAPLSLLREIWTLGQTLTPQAFQPPTTPDRGY